jgi:hypothetical protein
MLNLFQHLHAIAFLELLIMVAPDSEKNLGLYLGFKKAVFQ